MKNIINLKHWQTLLFSATLFTSFAISTNYTDPFFLPKEFFFFFTSGIFIVGLCIWYLNKKNNTEYSLSLLDITLVANSFYALIRAFFSPELVFGNSKLYIILICTVLYFLLKPNLFNNNKKISSNQITTLVSILVIIALAQSIWGYLQFSGIASTYSKDFNIGGAFGNPGQYANFLTPLLSFTVALFLFSKKNKWLGLLATVAIIGLLPLTSARTAWIGAFVIILYLLEKKNQIIKKFFNNIKTTLFKTTIVTMFAIAIVLSGYFLINLKKDSSSGRLFIWQVSLEMIKDKPLFGHGFDSFATTHNDYQAVYFQNHPDDIHNAELADNLNYAFNEFIQTTVEIGIIGCILLVLIFVFSIKSKHREFENNQERFYIYAAKGSIIAILISCLFSYPLQTIPSLLLLFVSLTIVDAQSDVKRYKIEIQTRISKMIIIAGIVLTGIFLVTQYNRNCASKEWLEAYKLLRENNTDIAYNKYKELYPTLRYSQNFLFNYGAELSILNKFEESNRILKEAEPRINDSDFYVYLGLNYEGLEKYDEAEKCFQRASYIIPSKLFSRYKLVEIYLKTNRIKEALKSAKNILDMKVKIQTPMSDAIRVEMEQVVNNYSR